MLLMETALLVEPANCVDYSGERRRFFDRFAFVKELLWTVECELYVLAPNLAEDRKGRT